MPLVKPTLQLQLQEAFNEAMKKFIEVSANGGKTPSQQAALLSASTTFGEKASTAIDAYIKTATVIIPPGQLVATVGSPAAQTGATTAPSLPAIIS